MSFDAARPRVAPEPRIQATQPTQTPAGAGSVNPTPVAPQPPAAVTPNYNSAFSASTDGAEAGIEPTQVSFGKNLFKPMDDAFGPILKDLAEMIKALDPEKAPGQLEKLGQNISEIAGKIGAKMAQAAQAEPASAGAAQVAHETHHAVQQSVAAQSEDDDGFEVMSFDEQAQPVAQEAQQAQPVAQEAQQAQPVAQEAQQAQPVAQEAQQAQPVAQEAQQAQPVAQEAQQAQPVAQEAQQVSEAQEAEQAEQSGPPRPVSETPIRDSIADQADTQGIDLKAQFDKQWAEVLENRDARAIAQFLELQIQRLREKAQSLIAPQP